MKNEAGKTFDCVAFKRREQARIYRKIKALSPEEEITYFRKAAERGPIGEWWRSIRRSGTKVAPVHHG